MIDPPSALIVAKPDMLSPQSLTWVRGFTLAPRELAIREVVISGYRELLALSTFLRNDAECQTIRDRLAELGAAP